VRACVFLGVQMERVFVCACVRARAFEDGVQKETLRKSFFPLPH